MRRRESKDGASVLVSSTARSDNRRKARYNSRYNYLHDTVVVKLNEIMKQYAKGGFDDYAKGWKSTRAVSNARPSRFSHINRQRTFYTDRFSEIREFMFQAMDHIRQSIVVLEKYENASRLRNEYERILSDPYMLMRYYQCRFKKVSVERVLYEQAQLNVVPILKPYIVEYINTYGHASPLAVRPIHDIDRITTFTNAITTTTVENVIRDVIGIRVDEFGSIVGNLDPSVLAGLGSNLGNLDLGDLTFSNEVVGDVIDNVVGDVVGLIGDDLDNIVIDDIVIDNNDDIVIDNNDDIVIDNNDDIVIDNNDDIVLDNNDNNDDIVLDNNDDIVSDIKKGFGLP